MVENLGHWRWSFECNALVYASEELALIHGVDPDGLEDLVGKRTARVIHPEDRDRVAGVFERFDEEGLDYQIEYRILRPDGEVRDVLEFGAAIRNDSGRTVQQIGTLQDITDRRRAEEALKRSEARLANAQRIAHLGNWEWDIVSDELFWSDETYQIFGLEPQGFATPVESFMDKVHREDVKEIREHLRRTLEEGTSYDVEHRILLPDGAVQFVHQRAEITCDEHDAPARLTGTVQDIDERKRTEIVLKESLDLLDQARRLAKLDYWAWDAAEDRIISPVQNKDLLSTWPAEATGLSDREYVERFVHPEDRDKVLKAYHDTLHASHPSYEIEYRLVRPGGEVRVVHEIGQPNFDAAGRFVGEVGSMQDISDRKRTEIALKDTLVQLEQAQKVAKLGYWAWDATEDKLISPVQDLGLLDNWPAEAAWGLSDRQYIEKFVHPEDRDKVLKAYYDPAGASNPAFEVEYRFLQPGGEVRIVHEIGQPKFDATGQLVAQFGTLQDVTDRKRAEQEILKLNAELEQRVEERTAELRAAQEELVRQERLAALGQLTGTVSHELRNPLGAMRSAVAAIKKLAPDDQPLLTRSVAIVDRCITRCDNIIGDLLDYSKVRPLHLETTPIDGWLSELLEEYEIPSGVSLVRELESGVELACDRDRLGRVLINLLDNACQAILGEDKEAPEGGHILTVSARQAAGCAEVSIGDTGPGIAPDDFARIFEPLYSSKAFGMGLGLSVVKRIVEQHGGEIEVVSELGRGTRFVLRLPPATPVASVAS